MEITEGIKVGMKREVTDKVTNKNTATAMKSGTLPVYATPAMSALMEEAAAELTQEYLPAGWTSVGITMNIAHNSASPVGASIHAEAEVTAVDGRKISYLVKAYDNAGEISTGTHERFAVKEEKFLQKASKKLSE